MADAVRVTSLHLLDLLPTPGQCTWQRGSGQSALAHTAYGSSHRPRYVPPGIAIDRLVDVIGTDRPSIIDQSTINQTV